VPFMEQELNGEETAIQQTGEKEPNSHAEHVAVPEETKQTTPQPKRYGFFLSIVTLIVFLVMIAVNALANILPINGLMTGDVSERYANLFAPAALTFSIWGLIYLLLAAFVVFQFFVPATEAGKKRLRWVQWLFILSSLANATWIFLWHYLLIPASVIAMLVILISLIVINQRLASQKLSGQEMILLRLPFSIYYGWITVATVANITALLVYLNWDGWGIGESLWTMLVLVVATIIALAVIGRNRDFAYGLVIVWAYVGILIKHLDPVKGFNGEHITVIVCVSICMGLVAAASFLALIGRRVRLVSRNKKEEVKGQNAST
jgi:hypothetical protein